MLIGDVLNIDPMKFYTHLYKTLFSLHAGNSRLLLVSSNYIMFIVLVWCYNLNMMLPNYSYFKTSEF